MAEASASWPADARGALSRLGAGIALILFAVVLLAGSRFLSSRQQHAYDVDPTPRASYSVTAGIVYQLSSATPAKQLIRSGVLGTLGCTWSADGQVDNQLAISSILTDERNRHQFALFVAPVTGPISITCRDVRTVFVDDADDAGPDRAAGPMLLATIVGLVGGMLTVSGGYDITR